MANFLKTNISFCPIVPGMGLWQAVKKGSNYFIAGLGGGVKLGFGPFGGGFLPPFITGILLEVDLSLDMTLGI